MPFRVHAAHVLFPDPPPWRLVGTGATLERITFSGQPFAEGVRVATQARPERPWDTQITAPVLVPVTGGDVLAISFSARSGTTAPAQVELVFEEIGGAWAKSIVRPFTLGSTWRRMEVAFRALADHKKNGAQVCLRVGYARQVVEVAGMSAVWHGPGALDTHPGAISTYEGRAPETRWRASANTRIERLRSGALGVEVVGPDGRPAGGASVRVSLERPEFPFGTAVSAELLAGPESNRNRFYRRMVCELFDRAVFENDFKWPQWQGTGRARSDEALRWLADRGLSARGHVLVWPSPEHLPRHVAALESGALGEAARAHVIELTRATRGLVGEWDVLNEPYSCRALVEKIGISTVASWFWEARRADPGAILVLNEADLIERGGEDEDRLRATEELIRRLRAAGAPIDALGLQGHFDGALTPPERLHALFDRLAASGLRLAITELDVAVASETLHADYLRDVLTIAYAHPAVDAVTVWGFWAGRHWRPAAALFGLDGEERPAGRVFRKLARTAWRIGASGVTDPSGRLLVQVTRGRHRIEVERAGRRIATRVIVGASGASARLALP